MSIAYLARDVARVIARDRILMSEYKQGCRDGSVRAVVERGRNHVLITDEGLCRRLEAANPGLRRIQRDEAS